MGGMDWVGWTTALKYKGSIQQMEYIRDQLILLRSFALSAFSGSCVLDVEVDIFRHRSDFENPISLLAKWDLKGVRFIPMPIFSTAADKRKRIKRINKG